MSKPTSAPKATAVICAGSLICGKATKINKARNVPPRNKLFLRFGSRLKNTPQQANEEAIVDLDRFVSLTLQRRDFHRAILRFEKEGYTFSEHKPPHSLELMDEPEAISDEWISEDTR